MKHLVLISKDALRKEALPTYGNTYWKTPNIDELAAKGTVFHRHYAAGSSTAMAITAMALGRYCYETDRRLYDGSESNENGNTIFDRLYDMGYDVHIAWDSSYTAFAKSHFRCEGAHTTVHSFERIIPQHERHTAGVFDDLTFLPEETERGLEEVQALFDTLSAKEKPQFLWLHMPHVFRGRNAYDSDIDVFDRVIGMARQAFGDECLFISADHGQMNGHKGKFGYGFDVEESNICIPLITPKFQGMDRVDFPTTAVQMLELFGLEPFVRQERIISETAYYVQPTRKVAILRDQFKLTYDKKARRFGLYDLNYDPLEEHNLFYPEFYDVDRRCWFSLNQRFFYPDWELANKMKEILLKDFHSFWRKGTPAEEFYQWILHNLKLLYTRLQQKKALGKIINIGK